MNWKLILLLSLFGLSMAIATVYVMPPNIEPLFWFPIFIASAFLIARRARGKYFLHGFLVGLTNWVWVAAAHVILFDAYMPMHAKEIAAMQSMPMPDIPRLMMLIVQFFRARALPVPGLSGVVIGLLSWIVSRFAAPKPKDLSR